MTIFLLALCRRFADDSQSAFGEVAAT